MRRRDPLAEGTVALAMEMGIAVIELVPSDAEAGWFTLKWPEGLAVPPTPLAAAMKGGRGEVCLVLHTSGTTSKPKIVPLTHENLCVGALCIASTLRLAPSDICLNVMPLFHIHGLSINLLATLLSGAAVLASPGFDPASFLAWLGVEQSSPTWYSAVPTMHLKVLRAAQESQRSTGAPPSHTLQFIRNCSAALLPSTSVELESLFGLVVMPTYAMTESMPIASNPRGEGRKLRSVGYSGGPHACLYVPLLDTNGEEAGFRPCVGEEEGEVCVRGKNVTAGYELRAHMCEDPNKAAFYVRPESGDRWLRTGDKGWVDSDGHLSLSGRFKEIISRGAEKISRDLALRDRGHAAGPCGRARHCCLLRPTRRVGGGGRGSCGALLPALPPLESPGTSSTSRSAPWLAAHACARHLKIEASSAQVLHPGRVTSLVELQDYGRERGLNQKWLPELVAFMSQVPTGPTGKPMRIGLAKKLGLKPIAPSAADGYVATWDVGKVEAGHVNDLSGQARPVGLAAVGAPPPSGGVPLQAQLAQYLADESALGHTAPAMPVQPTLSGIRALAASMLCGALREEAAASLRPPRPPSRIALDSPLALAGLESLGAMRLQARLAATLGCRVPVDQLLSSSVVQLAGALAAQLHFGSPPTALATVTATPSAAHSAAAVSPSEADPALPFEMSPLQLSYMMGRELDHGAWLYWENELSDFDELRFKWAMQQLVARHEALRTVMSADGLQRVQPLSQVPPFELLVHRSTATEAAGALGADSSLSDDRWQLASRLHALRARRRTWMPASFPLFDVQAVELAQGRGARVSFLFDLLVADAASLNVLMAELNALYTAPSPEVGIAALPPVTCSHREHVLAKQVAAASAAGVLAKEAEAAFWAARLLPVEQGGLPPGPHLPLLASGGGGGGGGLARLSHRMPSAQWEALQAQCRRFSLTPTVVLLSAYAAVLSTWSSKHFTMTLANFGRGVGAERVVGQLADVMLVEVDFRTQRPFVEAAGALGREVWRAIEHSTYTSGIDIMQKLNDRDDAIGRATSPFVFASVLGVGAAEEESASGDSTPFGWFGGVRPVPHSTALDTPQVHLDHQAFTDVDGALLLNWDFAADLFPVTADGGLAEILFESYAGFVRRLAEADTAAWEAPPSLVPRAHIDQQRQIQEAEHDSELLASLEPLHAPFFDEARLRRREAPAVCGIDGALTFAELADAALYWARRIQEADAACTGAPVTILIDKSCAQVVAVLAALAAGCAYVPISLSQPPVRILKILAAVECAVALVPAQPSPALAEMHFPDGCTPLQVQLTEHAQPGAAPPVAMAATPALEQLAYIIFTSGSTGEPKGVAISHRGASNTCKDINQRWSVGADDALLALAALSFDLSVYDLFGVLAAGGSLLMPNPGSPDPELWLKRLEEHRVTVWNTAPPVLVALLESLRADSDSLSRFAALPLRLVMLSGDFCPLWVPTELRRLLTDRVEVYTLGGATEASIWSCWFHVNEVRPDWRSIPYGGPLANQQLFVLDINLKLTPKLVPGEICIGGVGLAEEYWRDAAKTGKAFVHGEPLGYRQRLYRTGDVGRYMEDGAIEIVGRMDFQLKIRGYRIEIGEVEAALNSSEGVGGAVVLPWPPNGSTQLVGFVASEREPAETEAVLMAAARAALPVYMVPVAVHVLRKFVMSNSGKVDRNVLKEHHRQWAVAAKEEASSSPTAEEPRTESEVRLSVLWRKALQMGGGESLSIFRPFSESGGNSMSLLQLKRAVDEEWGLKVPLTRMLEHDTIVALATWLDNNAPGGGGGGDGKGGEKGGKALPNVVCFNRSGSGAPFFCVAPVSGQVLCYKQLAEQLGPEQPFYALQSPGINEGEAPAASVEAAAAALLQQLQSVVAMLPRGRQSFHLGGWSMGGVVAFEMALQLRRAGLACPSQLVLMDSPAPIDGMPKFGEREMVLTFGADMTSCRRALPLPEGGTPDNGVSTLLAMVLDELQRDVLPRDALERTFKVYKANLKALSAYRPKLDGGEAEGLRLHLLRAAEANEHIRRYPGHALVDLGWSRTSPQLRASSCLLYALGAGTDHYFITDPSQLPAVARIVGRLLRGPSPVAELVEASTVVVQAAGLSSAAVRTPPRRHSQRTYRSLQGPIASSLTSLHGPRPALLSVGDAAPTASPGPGRQDHAFRMASGASNLPELDRAVLQAYTTLLGRLRSAPHLLLLSSVCDFDAAEAAAQLRALCPSAVLHGYAASLEPSTHQSIRCTTDQTPLKTLRLQQPAPAPYASAYAAVVCVLIAAPSPWQDLLLPRLHLRGRAAATGTPRHPRPTRDVFQRNRPRRIGAQHGARSRARRRAQRERARQRRKRVHERDAGGGAHQWSAWRGGRGSARRGGCSRNRDSHCGRLVRRRGHGQLVVGLLVEPGGSGRGGQGRRGGDGHVAERAHAARDFLLLRADGRARRGDARGRADALGGRRDPSRGVVRSKRQLRVCA